MCTVHEDEVDGVIVIILKFVHRILEYGTDGERFGVVIFLWGSIT